MIAQRTTQEVRDLILAGIEAKINASIPLLPKAFTRVLARVLGAVYVSLYKYAGFIFLQLFVSWATIDETVINGRVVRPLVEWGRLFGVDDPKEATRALLDVAIAVSAPGGTLTAGTPVLSDDNGVTYFVLSDVPIVGTSVAAVLQARTYGDNQDAAGERGNLPAGAELVFATTPTGLSDTLYVTGVADSGENAETEAEYRERVMTFVGVPPQGGAAIDYVRWALGASGVVNAYPFTADAGWVRVYVEASSTEANPDGIPTQDQLDEVYALIEQSVAGLAERRPINARVEVLPIARVAIDIEIIGLDVPDESAAVAGVTAALSRYALTRSPYVPGVTQPPRRDVVSQGEIAGILAGAVAGYGGYFSGLNVSVAGSPISGGATVLAEGQKAKAGDVVV